MEFAQTKNSNPLRYPCSKAVETLEAKNLEEILNHESRVDWSSNMCYCRLETIRPVHTAFASREIPFKMVGYRTNLVNINQTKPHSQTPMMLGKQVITSQAPEVIYHQRLRTTAQLVRARVRELSLVKL